MRGNQGRRLLILLAAILISMGTVVWGRHLDVSAAASNGPNAGQQNWRLGQDVTYKNLTIFPVMLANEADTSEFATLDEALASGDAVVTEQGNYLRRTRESSFPQIPSGGAQVNQLVLINRGKRPLVLLAGEVVSGGRQDRIIGKDRIVPAGAAPLPLDVFCVEHGRWTATSAEFSAGKLMVHPSVREKAAVEQDQNRVWAAVRGDTPPVGQAGLAGAATVEGRAAAPQISSRELSGVIGGAATQSYQKIYESSPIGASVEDFALEFERRFHPATSGLKDEHLVGVVAAFGGEVVWSDIFASSRMFDAYWPKLLRSYAVEALTRPTIRETVSLEDAQDFLRPATGHVEEESEPGAYRWRKQSAGPVTEIKLDALAPKPITLHWLRALRAD